MANSKYLKIDELYSNEDIKYIKKLELYQKESSSEYTYDSFSDKIININENIEIREQYEPYTYQDLNNKIDVLTPNNFELETTTVWSFPNRGRWATHNPRYRGNWSPYIPRNLILRYSNKGDIVLDQFLGSGTTLIETKLLKRHGIGVDINSNAIEISKKNVSFCKIDKYEPNIIKGDARDLYFIDNSSIDLICTHPPYSNIIKYSEDLDGDLSLLDVADFVKEMKKVADECYRILRNNKYCAILIGDIRRNRHIVPLGFKVMQQFLDAGFILKEIVIKHQHNCKSSKFWYSRSIKYNFLLIAHEYLFIFRKP